MPCTYCICTLPTQQAGTSAFERAGPTNPTFFSTHVRLLSSLAPWPDPELLLLRAWIRQPASPESRLSVLLLGPFSLPFLSLEGLDPDNSPASPSAGAPFRPLHARPRRCLHYSVRGAGATRKVSIHLNQRAQRSPGCPARQNPTRN